MTGETTGLQTASEAPTSLLEGLETAVCEVLEISSLRHRSAALAISGRSQIPPAIVPTAHAVIAANWRRCRALRPMGGSLENWRWRTPKLEIAAHNASPEVVLERALLAACERRGRTDWSNQVPVASGIAGAAAERRRAVDLVHQRGSGHFELVELKVASDTPLYAAIEIIGYALIWLMSRSADGGLSNPLLAARRLDAVVLAPSAYYDRFNLGALQLALNNELAELGSALDVALGFRFEAFADELARSPFSDEGLMRLLDDRRPVWG